jgi:hypothetical protein
MMMEPRIKQMFDKALRDHVEYERAWWKNERRGRWVVLEPGPGRLLKGSSKRVREYVDAVVPQRGRRFRSLSRARAFAREVGGVVRRWRRHMHKRVGARVYKTTWRYETNPWKRATEHGRYAPWLLSEMLGDQHEERTQ